MKPTRRKNQEIFQRVDALDLNYSQTEKRKSRSISPSINRKWKGSSSPNKNDFSSSPKNYIAYSRRLSKNSDHHMPLIVLESDESHTSTDEEMSLLEGNQKIRSNLLKKSNTVMILPSRINNFSDSPLAPQPNHVKSSKLKQKFGVHVDITRVPNCDLSSQTTRNSHNSDPSSQTTRNTLNTVGFRTQNLRLAKFFGENSEHIQDEKKFLLLTIQAQHTMAEQPDTVDEMKLRKFFGERAEFSINKKIKLKHHLQIHFLHPINLHPKAGNYYATIQLLGEGQQRRTIYATKQNSLNFYTQFGFTNLNLYDTIFITFVEETGTKKKKAEEIGSTTVQIKDFVPTSQFTKLVLPLQKLRQPIEVSLVVEYSLDAIEVLPLEIYDPLIELICDPKLEIVILLEDVLSGNERVSVAKHLMRIYHRKQIWQKYIKHIILTELETCGDPNIVFRGSNLGTAALEYYAHWIGRVYLHQTLCNLVEHIYVKKLNCEITEGESNYLNLVTYLRQLLTAILSSDLLLPAPLQYLLYILYDITVQKFDKETGYSAIAGFFFLRFLVPAVTDPVASGLTSGDLSPQEHRTFALLAMCLQKIANRTLFQNSSELFMLNEVIGEYRKPIKLFVKKITMEASEEMEITNGIWEMDIAEDVACLVSLFYGKKEEILNKEPNDFVQRLFSLLDSIQKATVALKEK